MRFRASALRLGWVSLAGTAYLVTVVSEGREPVFLDLFAARALVCELRNSDEQALTSSLAFVVMPDHLHWLFQLGETSLSSVLRRLKSRSAIRINRLRGRPGARVWQKGYYDHALRGDEPLRDVARYIVGNPLRAKLVEKLGDYPHWDAVWMDETLMM